MIKDALLKDMLDSVSEGVYFVDLERRITYWNRSAERISGYRSEEVTGSRCSDNLLRHVDESGQELCGELCPLVAVMQGQTDIRAEVFLHHKDGHRVPVTVKALPFYDESNVLRGAIEVFTDRSERLAVLAELQELRKENLTDALTGLGNRRYCDIRLDALVSDLGRGEGSFGLLMIDIDHFKAVNDTYGHATGDRVLRMAAWSLANAVRRGDVAARWGGEEFVVLAPGADVAALAEIAERVRVMAERSWLTLEDGREVRATVSVGGAVARAGEPPAEVVARADRLLYRCKEAGRNRIMVE